MSNELMLAVFGLSGIAAGFLAGLFGIGGGLIMVPVLVYAFTTTGMAAEHIAATALGTSMAAIVFSAAQSAYAHYRNGSASIEMVQRTAPSVVVGVAIGSVIATRMSSVWLLVFVGCFQLFAAALMVADISQLTGLKSLATRTLALRLFSIVFGGTAALAGIGGGTLFTPYFKAAGMEPKFAIGTSAAIGLPVSVAGALVYALEGRGVSLGTWSIGYICVPALIALVLGTVLTVRLGVAVAHRLPSRALATSFAVFLVLNGAHLLHSVYSGAAANVIRRNAATPAMAPAAPVASQQRIDWRSPWLENASRQGGSAPSDAIDRAAAIHAAPGNGRGRGCARDRPRPKHDAGSGDAAGRIADIRAVHLGAGSLGARREESESQQCRQSDCCFHGVLALSGLTHTPGGDRHLDPDQRISGLHPACSPVRSRILESL